MLTKSLTESGCRFISIYFKNFCNYYLKIPGVYQFRNFSNLGHNNICCFSLNLKAIFSKYAQNQKANFLNYCNFTTKNMKSAKIWAVDAILFL